LNGARQFIFMDNTLKPVAYIEQIKVLSMKINYLAPFKHEHKHLKLVHEN
jgi:hypothetical protein